MITHSVLILMTILPWGKDAHLAQPPKEPVGKKKCETPLIGYCAEKMITFHREVISPSDGPRSHFVPTSSQYTLHAMRKYGFFQGFILGCDRLMRENKDPWIYGTALDVEGKITKYDPVR